MRRWKQLGHRALNRFGVDLVRIQNLHDTLGKHLTNVLAAKQIDCVIDVGANTGQYGKFLRGLGYKGRIVSFEPVKSVFDGLQKHCSKDPLWTCHNLALGNRTEERMLNVYSSTVFSSLHAANAYSKEIWRSLEDVVPERVQVVRLDEVFNGMVAQLGSRRPFLKLDTQGHDQQVFDGAAGCLDHIQALQSELSLIPIYENTPPAHEVLKGFNDAGFFVSGMYPINREDSMAVIEYDCVFVRRSQIGPAPDAHAS